MLHLEHPADPEQLEQQVFPVRLEVRAHPVSQGFRDSRGYPVHQDSERLALQGRLEFQAAPADLARQVSVDGRELLAQLEHRAPDLQDLPEALDSQDLREIPDHQDPLALWESMVPREELVNEVSRALPELLAHQVLVLPDS